MHRDMPLWLLSALKWQDPESGCFRFVEESDAMEDEMKQFKFWLNVKRYKNVFMLRVVVVVGLREKFL